MSDAHTDVIAAILAGGRSRRMGGGFKALAPLGQHTMIERVIDRVKGQVRDVLISVESEKPGFEFLPCTKVADQVPSHRGPLQGLYSVMSHIQDDPRNEWLLLCPCDAPFLPLHLADRLLSAALLAGRKLAAASYEEHEQPTFSLWHRSLHRQIGEAVQHSGGLMAMLDRTEHVVVEWERRTISPFFNVNNLDELAMAAAWLDLEAPQA